MGKGKGKPGREKKKPKKVKLTKQQKVEAKHQKKYAHLMK